MVYLVDFSVYKPPEECRFEYRKVQEIAWNNPAWQGVYNPENRVFIAKVLELSGLSHKGTFVPHAIHPALTDAPRTDMTTSLVEARMVMVGAVTDLLNKTGIKPEQVDILITNCSIYCPTPSLSSMLVNHFKFREDIQSYNLGGMGCSNGVVSVGLVKDLLKARPNSIALFVPAEITTYANYLGEHKNYHVATAIFRMGGAAALFSNNPALARRAKYVLERTERVHTGQDDGAYGCMAWQPDPDGINGVYLGKDVVKQAGIALTKALRRVAPHIMTWKQYAEAFKHEARKRRGKAEGEYSLDFTRTTIDHFAIHAGGYSVLKGVQAGMKLPHSTLLPSFAALRDYGNTSCSTTWYVMAYQETVKSIRRGQRVLQIGLGGGMKCGVNVWRALRDTADLHPAWEHIADCPLTEADLPRAIENEHGKNFTPEPSSLKPQDIEGHRRAAQEAAAEGPVKSGNPAAIDIRAHATRVKAEEIDVV